jgi:hypothetical protein
VSDTTHLIIAFVISLILPTIVWANNDPMRPPNFNPANTTTTSAARQWDITEILIADARRIAIINDTPVQAGDTIGNARVISINIDHVVLSHNNKNFKQYLSRTTVKQQTSPGTE